MVECFPVVGQCLEIKRGQECLTDIWKIQVRSIPKIHSIGDSMLIVRNHNQIVLSTGEGKPAERITGILPLFGKDDKDMTGLINSRLFQHLVGFSFTEQIDNIYPDAYMAALTALFMYTMSVEQTDFEKKLLEKIYWTLDILCQDQDGYPKLFIDAVQYNPELACSPYNERLNKLGYHNITQIFLSLFYLERKVNMESEEVEEVMQRVLVEYFAQRLSQKDIKLSNFVSFGEVEGLVDDILKEFEGTKILSKFYTPKQLRKYLSSDLQKELKKLINTGVKHGSGSKGIVLNETFVNFDRKEQISLDKINTLCKFYNIKVPTHKDIFSYLVHCTKNPQEVIRQRELVSYDMEQNSKFLRENIEAVTDANFSSKLIFKLNEVLPKKYFDTFKDVHFEVIPLTEEKCKSECKRLAIPYASLQFDPKTGLSKNACMAPKCPHYLQAKNKPIRNHMSGWQNALPSCFHSHVKAKKTFTPAQIFDFLKVQYNVQGDELYGYPRARVVAYIQHLIDFYRSSN